MEGDKERRRDSWRKGVIRIIRGCSCVISADCKSLPPSVSQEADRTAVTTSDCNN